MKEYRIETEIIPPLLAWYDEAKRILPWRGTKDPYNIWVSEIMLQQTRVEAVKPYYDRFLQALPTVRDLAGAEESYLLKLWEGLGYYNRVRNIAGNRQLYDGSDRFYCVSDSASCGRWECAADSYQTVWG